MTDFRAGSRAREALRDLEGSDYRGYDPYDVLGSPVFSAGPLRGARRIRFLGQQLFRRLPVNIRPVLRVRRGLSPVTVALSAEAYASLADVEADGADLEGLARECVARVADLVSPGYSGACWGYEFDWQARFADIRAGVPTVVATGLVTHSLFRVYELLGDETARELCRSAFDFVADDLSVSAEDGDGLCWSYSPGDKQKVLNATMLGARLCSEAHALGGEGEAIDLARRASTFVAARQAADGSWPYAVDDPRSWSDNHHSAYVLEGLVAYRSHSDDSAFDAVIDGGWRHYRQSFFTSDLVPKFRERRRFPIDATACAQSIITLCTFDDLEAACEVARQSERLLGNPDGSFGYQRHRFHRVGIRYPRWSCAPMAVALAILESRLRHSARASRR